MPIKKFKGTCPSLSCRMAAALSDSDIIPKLASGVHSLVQLLSGRNVVSDIRDVISKISGYPFSKMGVQENMHSFSLDMRLYQRLTPVPLVEKRTPRNGGGPLRVGIVGELSRGGAKPLALCSNFPEEYELYAFDVGFNGSFGEIPHGHHVHVNQHDLGGHFESGIKQAEATGDYYQSVKELCNAINKCNLDVLLIANYNFDEKTDIANLVDAPCLIHYRSGHTLLSHPKIDYALYPIRTNLFQLDGHKMYSCFTGKPLPAEPCYGEARAPREPANINVANNPKWSERSPRILFHGRLHKILSPPFLDVISRVLSEDSEVVFSFLGAGDSDAVLSGLHRRGIPHRQVEYLGSVEQGSVFSSDARKTIFSRLRDSRLAPDPWPRNGGVSRTEAYQAGTPSVHMRLAQDGKPSWDRELLNQIDLPYLEVSEATADSAEEYYRLCSAALHNEQYATRVIEEQYRVAAHATDVEQWWRDVIVSYEEWRDRRGWAVGLE